MKKAVKIILSITAAIIVCTSLLCGVMIYKTEYRLTDKGTELSPDGKYSVLFQMVGEPDWPFGATTVRATVTDIETGEKIEVIQTDIHDDGAVLRDYNWEVKWEEDEVEIIFIGSEQEDKGYIVALD
ncbi:MAG: hypothetical protein IJB86_09710 [Clostridia bacterium]|nr:hypothetical protein [Clostridia bacterium]